MNYQELIASKGITEYDYQREFLMNTSYFQPTKQKQ
jgi:hypothetical protein